MNIKNLSYRQKLKWLGIAAVPLFVICYLFGIARTIEAYRLYQFNQEQEQVYRSSTHSSAKLQARQKELNAVFSEYVLDTINTGRSLLADITQFADENGLLLREYKPMDISSQDTLRVLTRMIIVEGSFQNCVRLVYALEKEYKAGRVCSVLYNRHADPQTGITRLQCTLFIQNIIGRL